MSVRSFVVILVVVLACVTLRAQAEPMPLFWIKEGGKWGYIDKAGKVVIPLQFETTYGFVEGLAAAKLDGKFGFIDATGKWVIPPQFDWAYVFGDGMAWVRQGGKFGAIDRTGTMVIPPTFTERPEPFSEGMAAVKVDGKWGYVDKTGTMVIAPAYGKAAKFSGEVAQVETPAGKHLWIHRSGKVLWTEP